MLDINFGYNTKTDDVTVLCDKKRKYTLCQHIDGVSVVGSENTNCTVEESELITDLYCACRDNDYKTLPEICLTANRVVAFMNKYNK